MQKAIDIVIVNWNSSHLLKKCVNAIIDGDNEPMLNQLILVDNFSTDDSLQQLIPHEKIHIIRNQSNQGFAAACNQGFRCCTASYVLLLNPDTRILPGTLRKSCEFMERQKDVSVMGCQLLYENNQVAVSCSRFPTPLRFLSDAFGLSVLFPKVFTPALIMTDWDHQSSRYVDQVMGAFMLIRKETFQKIGLFDERFFVYYEDLDFSRRLSLAGGKTFFNADIRIYHIGKGTTASVTDFRLYLSLSSRMKYVKKYFSGFGRFITWTATFCIEPISRTVYYLVKGQLKEVTNIWKGYALFLRKPTSNPAKPS